MKCRKPRREQARPTFPLCQQMNESKALHLKRQRRLEQQVSVLPRPAKDLHSGGVVGDMVRGVLLLVEYAIGEDRVNACFEWLSQSCDEEAKSMNAAQLAEARIVWSAMAKDVERLRALEKVGRASANDSRHLRALEVFSREIELFAETGKGQ